MNTLHAGSRNGARLFVLLGAAFVLLAASALPGQAQAVSRVAVVFSGGHETDPQDRGRPVALIAAALGVPPQVFRDTFRSVRPAPAGVAPDRQRTQGNKAVLLAALGPYGVTNERLDAVSDHYRYQRSRGEHWPSTPATAYALVKRGQVIGLVITNGGSGYSSPPRVSVPGFSSVSPTVQLSWSKDFDKNGAVLALALPPVSK
ncbi:MAG: hypothetical protein M3Y13_10920 [Armatimonadota bacterium]|nr:hypothetical protein [Armatimonadota bacterium]